MSRKNSPPFLCERRWMVACIQPNLSSGEAVGWPRIPDRPGSWRFVLDGFMTPWSFDAFGSGSYASKRVGFSGPTMVLSETRGLQLFWVMRGSQRRVERSQSPRPYKYEVAANTGASTNASSIWNKERRSSHQR